MNFYFINRNKFPKIIFISFSTADKLIQRTYNRFQKRELCWTNKKTEYDSITELFECRVLIIVSTKHSKDIIHGIINLNKPEKYAKENNEPPNYSTKLKRLKRNIMNK